MNGTQLTITLYAQPISWMVAEILLIPLVWAVLIQAARGRRRHVRVLNTALLLAAVFMILYLTIMSRSPSPAYHVSPPFQLISTAVHRFPEMVRSLLLNILLFTPLGAAAVYLLPERLSVIRRILLTVVLCLALSICVEGIQYRISLGNAEMDDVLCNTAGALIGSLALPLDRGIMRRIFGGARCGAREE